MLLSLLLYAIILQSAPVSIQKLAANIEEAFKHTESDPELVSACLLASDNGLENSCDMRELFLKVPLSGKEADTLVATQRLDGSWPDINYRDTCSGTWQPSLHALRICRTAIEYSKSKSEELLQCALRAMDFWFSADLVYKNWWHKEIGIPRLMGPAFILLKDKMGDERLGMAIETMSAASLSRTGQNKIWLAGNVLYLAVIQENVDLAVQARDVLLSELRCASGEEGLQPDYSFHQHGPQMQLGNYGLSFLASMSWWIKVLKGTGLDCPKQKQVLLKEYAQNGLSFLIWNGYFDPNACGRQVFPNTQMGKALCIRYALLDLDLPLENRTGARYYPLSDFGVFRGEGWYASIRMQSSRTVGFENTNGENMKGYFSSDGALLVRLDGDEYDNIWPYWDWHRIPGVTAWDDGFPIWGNSNGNSPPASWPFNKSNLVSGLTKNGRMIAAMDYDRDTLRCRKSWFFYDSGIVCLGAGITKTGNAIVTTAIEQSRLRGPVRQGRNCVYHNNISYFLLEDAKYQVSTTEHLGKWSWMNPALSDEYVQAPIFEIVIYHGSNSVDASYA